MNTHIHIHAHVEIHFSERSSQGGGGRCVRRYHNLTLIRDVLSLYLLSGCAYVHHTHTLLHIFYSNFGHTERRRRCIGRREINGELPRSITAPDTVFTHTCIHTYIYMHIYVYVYIYIWCGSSSIYLCIIYTHTWHDNDDNPVSLPSTFLSRIIFTGYHL